MLLAREDCERPCSTPAQECMRSHTKSFAKSMAVMGKIGESKIQCSLGFVGVSRAGTIPSATSAGVPAAALAKRAATALQRVLLGCQSAPGHWHAGAKWWAISLGLRRALVDIHPPIAMALGRLSPARSPGQMGRHHRGLPTGNRPHRPGYRPGYFEAATGCLPADPARDHGRSTDVANLARRNSL